MRGTPSYTSRIDDLLACGRQEDSVRSYVLGDALHSTGLLRNADVLVKIRDNPLRNDVAHSRAGLWGTEIRHRREVTARRTAEEMSR